MRRRHRAELRPEDTERSLRGALSSAAPPAAGRLRGALPFAVYIAAAFLSAASLFSSCSFDYRESRLAESLSKELPNSVLTDYRHTSVRAGKPVFTISAQSSSVFRQTHKAVLHRVDFQEFDDSGEPVTKGSAENATVFTQSDNVELSGNIRFRHLPDDFSVSASFLYWDNAERSLEGKPEELVRIRRGDGSTIEGRAFSSSGIYRRIQFDDTVQGTYVSEKGSKENPGGPSEFSFSGDSTSLEMQEGKRRTLLSGNARISSDKTSIRADSIELYGEGFRFARCNGNVETEERGKEIHLSSRTLFYDREKELLKIEGYNEMVDRKNELVAKSGYLEHRGEEDVTIFQIGVRILKAAEDTKMVCRGEFARYEREENRLTLSGMPEVRWKDDLYKATRIIINLDSDEIRLEGDVEGTVTTLREGEEE
jgi:lipopolysaccharide export system protein LptA